MNSLLVQGNSNYLPLADKSIHCVVTSPPYFGLRDYEVAGQIGLEASVEAYTLALVYVFREVRRVLRDDGTLWLNLGDSYNGSGGAGGDYGPGGSREGQPRYPGRNLSGLKKKDLIGIPWLVALALRSDGWYLRKDIIWYKPNAMPSSTRDRPSASHEYLFLLSKRPRYYYDWYAILEPFADGRDGKDRKNWTETVRERNKGGRQDGYTTPYGWANEFQRPGRNKRSVWTIPTEGTGVEHFAAYPRGLVEPCIKAGTSGAGVCSKCGRPARRDENRLEVWEPGCLCDADRVPATVLDPFSGTGTTGMVAQQLGRRYVGIELNPEYLQMAQRRLGHDDLRAWEKGKPGAGRLDDLPLFGGMK